MTEPADTELVQAKQRLELAALFQFTYLGAPMTYYGDEVVINSPSRSSSSNGPIGDPYTRAPYPWLDQVGDPAIYGPPDTSVEAYYTKLAHLRKQYPVLRNGSFMTLLTGDTQQSTTAPNTYAYARVMANEASAVIAMNNGSASNTAMIPVGGVFSDGTQWQDAISGATYSVGGGNVEVTLGALTGVVLLLAPVNLDLTPPVASISTTPGANGNGWINSLTVSVNLNATDSGSRVAQLRYWINNGPVSAFAGSSASTQLTAEGSYSVGLRAVDNAGNISPLATSSFGIDVTPPAVNVAANPSSLWPPNGNLVPVTVSGTITDALSGVNPSTAAFVVTDEYGLIQPHGPVTLGTGGNYSFGIQLQAARNGNDLDGRQYTITVSANDYAGNLGSGSTRVTVPHDQGQ